MKKLFLFLFIISSFCAFSQNWSIINSNERYHYKTRVADFYTNTVQVDSFKLDGLDFIFYLNTICKPCDTCSILGTYIANQEQCFNKIVRKMSNGNYAFYLPDTFYINANDAIGDTWIYRINALDTIYASISNIDTASVLGIPDSVKTILLSNNDTLLLSKNHGMIQMKEQSDSQVFELIGLQTQQVGFTLPTWREFYDFNVGDSFFYYIIHDESGHHEDNEFQYKKIYILSKTITDTSLIYYTYYVSKIRYGTDYRFYEYTGNSFITYSSDLWFDYYNFKNISFEILTVQPDGSRIKLGHTCDSIYNVSVVGDNTFLIPSEGCVGGEFEMLTGLGSTLNSSYACLSSFDSDILICYNDTGINVTPFLQCSDFYSITAISSTPIVNIGINYNENQINLENPNTYHLDYRLVDNQGRTILSGDSREANIEIDISTLSHGMYYLKASVAGTSSTYKILK